MQMAMLFPNATLPLHFSINGNGEIIATGNANPSGCGKHATTAT